MNIKCLKQNNVSLKVFYFRIFIVWIKARKNSNFQFDTDRNIS